MFRENWEKYVDHQGNFALPTYLYKSVMALMKISLDYGTLLSTDQAKLRAYKEMIKTSFKDKWLEIAKSLEYFDLITPCTCNTKDFCSICGGSRFLPNENLTPDQMREVSFAIGMGQDSEILDKLQKGLAKALREIQSGSYSQIEE